MYARCTLLNYDSGQSVFVIVQCFIAQSVGAQSYNYVYPCELVRRCLSRAVRPVNSSLSIQSCNVQSCNFSTPVTTANAMKYVPLCTSVTSFTKPEVRNILHCRQRRTTPHGHVEHVERISWSWNIFETCERTERHADRNTSQPSWERS